jgi:AcrR family transcriptional regulator
MISQKAAHVTKPKRKSYDDLREACVLEAIAIVESDGIERLSLREVSRRLGVSHQAPYKHFPSRDHILAEVVRRTFVDFAAHLDARPMTGVPEQDLESLGRAYLHYAVTHPRKYHLMFSTPLPSATEHPDMMSSAQHAFDRLQAAIGHMNLPTDAHLDAMFVWATMHGIAGILQTQIVDQLGMTEAAMQGAVNHIMGTVHRALTGNNPDHKKTE